MASDGSVQDFFGRSVAIYNDTVLVGAQNDDNENGIDAGHHRCIYSKLCAVMNVAYQ